MFAKNGRGRLTEIHLNYTDIWTCVCICVQTHVHTDIYIYISCTKLSLHTFFIPHPRTFLKFLLEREEGKVKNIDVRGNHHLVASHRLLDLGSYVLGPGIKSTA